MNVLFVNYHDFTSNSAIHIFNLANHLADLGVVSAVAVPENIETVELLGVPRFTTLDFSAARRGAFGFPDGRGPDLIHTWTPREGVRKLTVELSSRFSCPYVVHLEDNEDVISAGQLGVDPEMLERLDDRELDRRLGEHLSHPRRFRQFVEGATGITVILDRLLEFVPEGSPAITIWPAFEEDLFFPQDAPAELVTALGLDGSEHVLVYAGNVHPANAAEVRSLYLAVALLERRGLRTRLIRLGRDFVDFLGEEKSLMENHVTPVPFRPRAELPSYYALADAFVQPGRADGFNDYRFPSKLPEFFAMGIPVVLPRTNVGRVAADGEDCLLLDQGDALDIARKLERIFGHPELASHLGRGARTFAERHFSWSRSAATLRGFYDSVTHGRSSAIGAPSPHHVYERYRTFSSPALGYATVRDYCDSADSLPFLASLSGDMKDVQRPWVLKAVAGAVPPGGRLLEIGAGEPHVADLLSQMGYEVTIVDPYDGRDRGPSSFDAIAARYPNLDIRRGLFPDALGANAQPFDCVYSISVLEHVPSDDVSSVCAAILRYTRPGGRTVHAIDHVLLGNGDEEHLDRLRRIISSLGLDTDELEAVLGRLERDVETYFLSAEGHNRWRGSLPYDEFPMRRCVSIECCVAVSATENVSHE